MNLKTKLILSFVTFFFSYTVFAYSQNNTSPLQRPIFGIIVPLEDESIYLQKNIQGKKNISIDGIQYTLGKINNKNIVFVNSGIGKVNAAIIATRLIRDFHPDYILMSGSSGALTSSLKKGDVVVGDSVVNVDLGRLTVNGPELQTEYLSDPQTNRPLPLEFKLEKKLAYLITENQKNYTQKIILGKIATSDALPNLPDQVKLLQQANFDVIEMEGASVMQSCWSFNTPCIIIRGVSNNAGEPITRTDTQIAGNTAGKAVVEIISSLRSTF